MLYDTQDGHHRNAFVAGEKHVRLVAHTEVVLTGADSLQDRRRIGRRVHRHFEVLFLEVALLLRNIKAKVVGVRIPVQRQFDRRRFGFTVA